MFKLFSKRKNTVTFFVLLFLAACVFFGSALYTRYQNQKIYDSAIEKIKNQKYQEAVEELQPLQYFKETQNYVAYAEACIYEEDGKYLEAIDIFNTLGNFKDSVARASQLQAKLDLADEQERQYKSFCDAYMAGEYQLAIEQAAGIENYKDVPLMLEETLTQLWIRKQVHTVTAGIQFSAGVTVDGSVLFSGENFDGEADILSWTDIISVSASNEFLAGLKEDGTVSIAKRKPKYSYRIDTGDWRDIISVSVGEQFIVGLKKDGTLTAQGIDGYGETDIDGWKDIIAIDTGWQHTVGLDRHGNIHITGFHAEQMLAEIESYKGNWVNIKDIATGGSTASGSKGRGHVVALREDGSVVAAGDNTFGQCNVSDWTNIIAIDAGDYHTVGLRSDGTVLTTQDAMDFPDSYEDISSWTGITAIAAGYGFTLGLQEDGTVVAAGLHQNGQCNVSSWANVRQP